MHSLLRRLTITLALYAAAPLALAQTATVPDGLTGAWWDPQRSGQGLLIEQVEYPDPGRPDQLQAYWYSYDGTGAPVYLVGVSDYRNGRAEIDLLRTSGGRHGLAIDPSAVTRTPWGRVIIEGLSCERIRVSYTPLSGPGGAMEMTRLATALSGATARASCEMVQPVLGTVTATSCNSLTGCRNVTLPSRSSSSSQTSIVGSRPADYEIRTYTLTAVNGNVNVAHVSVDDSHPATAARVAGITQGQTLRAGESVTISLRSDWTNNVTETLRFKIALTYQGFAGSASNLSIDDTVQLRTN